MGDPECSFRLQSDFSIVMHRREGADSEGSLALMPIVIIHVGIDVVVAKKWAAVQYPGYRSRVLDGLPVPLERQYAWSNVGPSSGPGSVSAGDVSTRSEKLCMVRLVGCPRTQLAPSRDRSSAFVEVGAVGVAVIDGARSNG